MISELVLKIAFRIHHSPKYKQTKTFFREIFYNPSNSYKKYVDLVMIFLILSSVMILVYEVQNPVPYWIDLYDIYFVTIIFFAEYILRIWVHSDMHIDIIEEYNKSQFLHKEFSVSIPLKKALLKKFEFIVSPSAIIDLLAILPAYRPLRILRIFVLFRVFKLLRYTKSINQFLEVLGNKKFELLTLLFLLLFIVFTAGIAIYVFEEGENPKIATLFDSFYWALVTISTVGYGDISPVTTEGRAISMAIIVSGIAMISFVTSVIVSAFSEKLDELKENRVIEEVNKNDEFIIVCGYGQLAKMFFRQEKDIGDNYVIIDKDPDRVRQAIKDGHKAIRDDASRHDVISKFDTKYSNITILCLTDSDIENIYIALNAKSISKKIHIIARASSESMHKKFRLAGADHIVTPSSVANMMLRTAISQPVLYAGMQAILTGKSIAHIDELAVFNHTKLIGKKIMDIDFAKYKILFMGIQRGVDGDFIFNPSAELSFEKDDILLIMGVDISLEHFREQYRGID